MSDDNFFRNAVTPWRAESPANDSNVLDVYDKTGNKIHHGKWGSMDVSRAIAALPDLIEALVAAKAAIYSNNHQRQTDAHERVAKALKKAGVE